MIPGYVCPHSHNSTDLHRQIIQFYSIGTFKLFELGGNRRSGGQTEASAGTVSGAYKVLFREGLLELLYVKSLQRYRDAEG